MNRDALDAWFAQAEDVLTDWRPGGDAMHATPPADEDEGRLPARADSYYDQGDRTLRMTQDGWLARTVAEFERLRSTVMVGPGSGWVVEIRDGVGRWHNLSRTDTYDFSDGVDGWDTPRIAFPEAVDGRDDTP